MKTVAEQLHEAADETNDAADHDELHAAGALVELATRHEEITLNDYVRRWIISCMARAGVQ